MAKTPDEWIKMQLGSMMFEIAVLQTELQQAREALAKAEAEKKPS